MMLSMELFGTTTLALYGLCEAKQLPMLKKAKQLFTFES